MNLKTKNFFILFLSLTIFSSMAHAFNLPDTGQTKCYRGVSPYDEIPCAGTGQDGAYNINPMSFTDNGNGTVTDNNTGIMWQKCSVGQTNDTTCSGTAVYYNWYKASGTYDEAYNPGSTDVCGNLVLGGYSDWRLPAKKELMSIVDYLIPYPGTTVNATYFPNTTLSFYWSSTTWAYGYPDYAWGVPFGSGYVSSQYKGWVYLVRCVRGGQSATSFTDNGNGTVTDTKTGLVWQQSVPGQKTWDSALSYCEGLSLGGNTDWRLPNIKELESITDDTRYNPAIDTNYFPNEYASYYWSSTTPADYPGNAWLVSFYNGNVLYGGYKDSYGMYVRCVRGGQSGSFGDLDHFDITGPNGNPITDKAVNEQFQIKITAKNDDGTIKTNWTGKVHISATNGGLSLSYVTILTGGTATATVSINTPGTNVQIRAMGGGMSGTSESFNVIGGSACYGSIGGSVQQDGSLLSGASVYLNSGSNYYDQVTINGQYQFAGIPAGNYTLWASYNGGESEHINVNIGCNSGGYEPLIVLPACNPSGKTPILLVPGIMGSTWKKNDITLIPTLPAYTPDIAELEIYDDFTTDYGWQTLKSILHSRGYVDGCTLFEVPYDWRLFPHEAVVKYLKPMISEAKEKSGAPMVNVIAHSMGGLVTRHYIQGSYFYPGNLDIDRFAMVGTPNHGSALVYPLLEGGDPVTADLMGGGGSYTSVILYQVYGPGRVKEHSDSIWKIANTLCNGNWVCYSAKFTKYYIDIATYIIGDVPSLLTLLPTYDFLIPHGSLQCQKNTWLDDKNNSATLSMLTKEDDPDPLKVRTKIFMGNDTITLTNIGVAFRWCSNPFYPDGIPIPFGFQKQPLGDGTVLTSSANLGTGVSYGGFKNVAHSKLINAFAGDIADFIDAGAVSGQSLTLRSSSKIQAADNGSSTLSFSIKGRVRPLLISPSAQRSGIDNNLSVNEIPNAEVSVGTEAGNINLENPADGTYTVIINGTQEEDYSIVISYNDSLGESSLFSAHVFNHANTTSFTFTVNSGNADKITVNHTPLPPANLQADAIDTGGLKTHLTWTASADPDVTGYNIYSKYDDEPYLAQIGTATTNTFDTGHPWSENSSIKTRLYAVSAVKADGTESFLSNMVENNDRDHDGLTDEEEASYGTNVTNPDSDGDGLNDGAEYVRGTNPLLTDTDGDGYSDYAEIQAGSDPLDASSMPPLTGDMNGDGIIDISDVILVLRIALKIDPVQPCSDLNNDGIVDISDVILTLRMALGIDALKECI